MVWVTIPLKSKAIMLYTKIQVTTNTGKTYAGTCIANTNKHISMTLSGESPSNWKTILKSDIVKLEILRPDHY